MNGHFVNLTDGTRIEVKLNFGTLYHLQKCGASKLAKKIEKKQKNKQDPSEFEKMEFAAKVIYAVLRSNGKKVTFDEALELMPPDPEEMGTLVEAYQKEVEKIKKKEESKRAMKNFAQK